ncbi:MAG TPA: restriction endonuclease [Thermoguttaceae bacterium]
MNFTVVLIVLAVIIFFLIVGHFERAERERRLRALRLADVDNMAGIDFEHYVCRLLVYRGFTANVTRSSGDLGVDIVAQRNFQKYAIQVKRHRKGVSRRAVSDAVAGKQHYGCDRAMVITNSYFTKGAKELAQSTGCELINRDSLAEWILDFQGHGENIEQFDSEQMLPTSISEVLEENGMSEDDFNRLSRGEQLPPKFDEQGQPLLPSQMEQPNVDKIAMAHRKPIECNLPKEVLEGIRGQAAKAYRGDYSTQLFVVDQQTAAYQELQKYECPQEIPSDVFQHLKSKAGKDYPLDFSTQLFVVHEQLSAYDKIEQYKCPRDIPTSDFQGIKDMAAQHYPYDYSTQLFVIKQQVEAYLKLQIQTQQNTVRHPAPIVADDCLDQDSLSPSIEQSGL